MPAGANGSIDVYVTNDTDVVLDINGYFAPPGTGGLSLYTLQPCRALDTRNPAGSPPFTGTHRGECGGQRLRRALDGAGVCVQCHGSAADDSHGFLTLWQQNAAQPAAANLNDPTEP